jgi:hypothetical protein
MRTRAVTTYGESNTHSILIGYLLWIFGFMGSHRYWTLNGQIDAVNAEAWRPQRVDRRRRISAYGRSAARAR